MNPLPEPWWRGWPEGVREMLDRACEVYGKPVPLRVLRDADEGDICKSCQEMFFEDRIEEDKCPVCGAEGFMCSGILVNSGLQEEFIVFP